VVPEVLYVASDTDHRVQLFNVGMRDGAAAYLVPSTFFILNAVGTTSGASVDSRGIRFSADGKRLYLVNRQPPSIQIYDTTIGPDGAPNNALLGTSDLCRQGSTAAVAGAGTDERVYITCFQEGQIYAVNPFGQSQVEDIITVGRGPYAADVLSILNPPPMLPTPKYLFVTNVLEDTIAVIDIDPSSPTRHRVVLRIGTPRAP
jgi:DNA-binding beta-propeller fold protein YncE